MMEKILPVVVSTSIVILLFILGRILDSYIKAKEVKRNWYQKVIIDPNIAKVDSFYIDILEQAKNSISLLISKATIAHNEYILKKTTEIEKFKVIKRKFEFEFIMLIQTNNPEIASDLSEHLRDIEDSITNCLDKNNLTSSDFSDLELDVISKKPLIFGILYKPLIYQKSYFRDLINKIRGIQFFSKKK